MILAFDFSVFNVVGQVLNYITTLLTFLTSMVGVVISLLSTFFTTMPTFVSIGFSMIFGLGITIMIIKLVR